MGKELGTQVQEAHRVPGRINPRRNMPRHIVIKLPKIKDKEKLLKSTRGKQTNKQTNHQENVTPYKERKQAIESDQEITQISEFAHKNYKMSIMKMFKL